MRQNNRNKKRILLKLRLKFQVVKIGESGKGTIGISYCYPLQIAGNGIGWSRVEKVKKKKKKLLPNGQQSPSPYHRSHSLHWTESNSQMAKFLSALPHFQKARTVLLLGQEEDRIHGSNSRLHWRFLQIPHKQIRRRKNLLFHNFFFFFFSVTFTVVFWFFRFLVWFQAVRS